MSRQRDEQMIDAVALAIFRADQAFDRIDGVRLPDRHFKIAICLYRAMASAAITAVDARRAGHADDNGRHT